MIAACVLAGFVPLATGGCFGGFNLTRKVYKFNKQVSNDKFIREIVFLVMLIVPIYELATLADALFFNLIEFWSGKNLVLVKNGDSQTIQTAQGSATLTRLSADALEVRVLGADGEERHFVMRRENGSFAALSPDGALLARVADVAGQPALVAIGN
jgi:hypothetical protein